MPKRLTPRRVRKAFVISLGMALMPTLALPFPFVGMAAHLLASPLHRIWPDLGHTSDLVAFGFAWIVFKQEWLWAVFYTYYFVIIFVAVLGFLWIFYPSGKTGKMVVLVGPDGKARCPFCGDVFDVNRPDQWDGVRHRMCGVELNLRS